MNPYLAFPAMLMAGLDGIRRKIDPGDAHNMNLETLSHEEFSKIHQLPTSLDKALSALEKDHQYLLEGSVFTEDLLEHWIKLKWQEVDAVNARPTPHEFELYYNL